MPYATWVEINLSAIEHNVRRTRAISGSEVMAVVKANAYGHGAIPVARAALRAGATWLAVARLDEGLALRKADIRAPILLLGYIPPERVETALRENISLTVWRADQIEHTAAVAAHNGLTASLHLKVDTGMNRLGAPPEAVLPLAEQIARHKALCFEGLFTHFARADENNPHPTDEQHARFARLLERLEKAGLRPQRIHAANSAAALHRPAARYDMVRLGIAMYGLHPSSEKPAPADFRPALSWKAVLSHVKTVPPGSGISYGHVYVTRGHERIGTLPVGYADGLRRLEGNIVLVHGQRVPVVGRVCMDQCMLQLDEVPAAAPGDEVVLIGRQGEEHITAEEVAAAWGTINYEVVCAIGARVPRVYVKEENESA